jgi:hypothetical protein
MQQCNTASTGFVASRLAPALLISLIAAGGASAATLSVGPGKTYSAPCAAFNAARDGDTIEISGNNIYKGDVCGIARSNLIIRGVNGRPMIDANGANAMGKGIWVVGGNNVTVENVALRLEGTGFTLRQSFLHDNENGILSGANTASDILVEYSEFGHNGFGDGYTHNLYIGNVRSLTFRYNYSHDANAGHNLKSRAQVNTIYNNRFSSTAPGQSGSTASGSPSYEIDLPNAGTSYVIGNVIEQPAANSNPNIVAYGEEGASNPGKDLYVVNNTFLNDAGSGTFVMVGSAVSTPVLLQNNVFAGVGSMTNQGNATFRTNYNAAAPAFVNRTGYDLHPAANSPMINAASAPGVAPTGFALAPIAQYQHVASGEPRANVNDIGAYAANGAAATPTPTPPAATGWTQCTNEGGTCAFSGTREVRYGAGTTFVSKTVTGSVACTNAVFGDPTPNVAKTCSYAATAWTPCANEGGTCAFSGTHEVRYGSGTTFVSKTVTGSTACTNAVFGDPTPNVAKTCSYAGDSAAAPAPETWSTCAGEEGTCTFSGTRDVRFGAGSSFVTRTFTGAVLCSNTVFGDPAYGVVKSCSVSSLTK